MDIWTGIIIAIAITISYEVGIAIGKKEHKK